MFEAIGTMSGRVHLVTMGLLLLKDPVTMKNNNFMYTSCRGGERSYENEVGHGFDVEFEPQYE